MAYQWLVASIMLALMTGCGKDDDRDKGGGPALGGTETCSFDDTGAALSLIDGEAVTTPDDEESRAIARQLGRLLPAGMTAVLADFRASRAANHYDFRYVAGGISVCGALAQAHQIGERLVLSGQLSAASLAPRTPGAWQNLGALSFPDQTAIMQRAMREVGGADAAVSKTSRCWLIEDGAPVPALDLTVRINGMPYHVLGERDHLVRVSPAWFEAAGAAQVYEKNAVDGTLVTVPLTDLADGPGLKSKRFVTLVGSDVKAAESEDRQYIFEPTDERFVETSMFTNAERMAAWFLAPEHDYKMGCVPITVEPHVIFRNSHTGETSPNNGLYLPPDESGTGYPMIRLGDGDGQLLQNLGTDFDAVAHELGHHVLFRRIKTSAGESGVIHEALADYFVYAATGDACLAESVCPAGSSFCFVDGQCLRTGDNALRYDSPELPPPGEKHMHSQFLSAYLWDVGGKHGVGHDQVATTVLKALDYVDEAPGYTELIQALMDADLELAAGVNACTFLDAAKERGMTELVEGLSCE